MLWVMLDFCAQAEKQREQTVGLQAEVGKSQEEIARRTDEVKKELAEAEPAVDDAKQAVQVCRPRPPTLKS